MKIVDKLTNLYSTKKWLFYLLLPLVIVAIGIKKYLEYLEYKSQKDLSATNTEDQKLRFKQRQLRKKAKEEEKKAKELRRRIKNRNENKEDVDENWHLKE